MIRKGTFVAMHSRRGLGLVTRAASDGQWADLYVRPRRGAAWRGRSVAPNIIPLRSVLLPGGKPIDLSRPEDAALGMLRALLRAGASIQTGLF